jgi:hypothetical protein
MPTKLHKQLEDAKSFIADLKKARSSAETRDALFAACKGSAVKLADLATAFGARNGFEAILVKYTKIILNLRRGFGESTPESKVEEVAPVEEVVEKKPSKKKSKKSKK